MTKTASRKEKFKRFSDAVLAFSYHELMFLADQFEHSVRAFEGRPLVDRDYADILSEKAREIRDEIEREAEIEIIAIKRRIKDVEAEKAKEPALDHVFRWLEPNPSGEDIRKFNELCAADKAKEAHYFVSNDGELREVSTKAPVAEVSSWTEASILAYAHYTREGLIDQIEGFKADLDDAIEVAYHRGADEWTRLNYPDKFERLEKAAKGLGSELAERNASKPENPEKELTSDDMSERRTRIHADINSLKDRPIGRRGPWNITNEDIDRDQQPTTPHPVITGVGEYKTQGGEKIYVGDLRIGVWIGSFVKRGQKRSWSKFGTYLDDHAPHHDIIGPWPKPEEEVKPERVIEGWVNVYENGFGNSTFKSEIAAKGARINNGHLATIRISHTEGDE